jgi:glycine dehydrogenase
MLDSLGYESMEAFLQDCVPQEIRLDDNVIRDEGAGGIRALSEGELLRRAKEIGKKNKVTRSFIGLGYHQAVSLAEAFLVSSHFYRPI